MSAILDPPLFAPGLAQVNITPFVARQKVNLLMLDQVGNLLHGGEPELLVSS